MKLPKRKNSDEDLTVEIIKLVLGGIITYFVGLTVDDAVNRVIADRQNKNN